MNLTNHFEFPRFRQLLITEAFRNRKAIVMTFFLLLGALMTGFFVEPFFVESKIDDSHPGSYACSLLLGGFIVSSMAFSDLSSTLKKYQYLTMPVSAFEKVLAAWLITTFGWIVLFTLGYTIYTYVSNAMGLVLFRHMTYLVFDPLGEVPLTSMRCYFVLQGIFLVGATHFKGYAFPKTVLVLMLFCLIAGLLAYFIMADLLPFNAICTSSPMPLETMSAYPVFLFLKGLFWWALAPVCWVITYISLTEKEA